MWKERFLLSIITISVYGSFSSAQLLKSGRSRDVHGYEHPRPATNEELHNVDYVEEEEDSTEGKLIGSWRNNGEALEPNWRDGDSVPLVPFYVATVEDHLQDEADSKEKQVTMGPAAIQDEYSTKQYSKHPAPPRKFIDQTSSSRYDGMNLEGSISSTERYSIDADYDDTYANTYRDSPGYKSRSSTENKYPRPATKVERFEGLDKHYKTNYSFKNHENINDPSSGAREKMVGNVDKIIYEGNANLEGVVTKYRETFQNRPDEYELSEDEYEKPRPRKRRPPQNDEFAEPRNSYPTFKSNESAWSEANNNSKLLQTENGVNARPYRRSKYLSRNTEDYHSMTRGNSKEQDRLSENTKLKLLLKMQQDEELSLSEILQQKNLTLMDLLQGKANVISILKLGDEESKDVEESSSIMTKNEEITNTERPRWIPNRPNRRLKTNGETTVETSSGEKIEDHFPQRFPPTNKNDNNNATKESEKFPITDKPLTKFNFSNELATTENSIIKVTSKDSTELLQGDVSNVNRDAYHERTTDKIDEDEIMEFSDFTVIKPKTSTSKTDTSGETSSTTYTRKKINNVHQDRASTLSIEHLLTSTEQTVIENLSQNKSVTKNKIDFLNKTDSNDLIKDYRTLINVEHENQTNILKTLELKHGDDDMQQSIQHNDKTIKVNVQNRLNVNRNCSVNRDKIESTTISEKVTSLNGDKVPLTDHTNLTSNYRPYEDIMSEVEPVARAEIFELLNSGSSAKKLEQLLKSRNMSLDELIALRQRGSSQVHLAEVLRSREENLKYQKLNENVNDTKSKGTSKTNKNIIESKYIETTHTPIYDNDSDVFLNADKNTLQANKTADNNDNTSSTHNYFNKEIEKVISNLSNYHKYLTNTSSNETDIDKNINSINSNDNDQIIANSNVIMEESTKRSTQLFDLITAFDSLPFSKNIRQDSEGSSYYTSITEVKIPIHETYDSSPGQTKNYWEKTKYPANNPASFIDEGLVEEIVKNDLETISEMYGSTIDANDKKDSTSKVKPSIIASGAILGVTIVVFLAIFIVCRIRQKQKFTYKNTFSKAMFQDSAMAVRKLSNSSSLNTVMVNAIATSTTKRSSQNHEIHEIDDDDFESNDDIENDSLDANDSWETIPDFLK